MHDASIGNAIILASVFQMLNEICQNSRPQTSQTSRSAELLGRMVLAPVAGELIVQGDWR